MYINQDEHIEWIEHGIKLIRNAINQSTSLNDDQRRRILFLTWKIVEILGERILANDNQ